jgi:hypothetical protein
MYFGLHVSFDSLHRQPYWCLFVSDTNLPSWLILRCCYFLVSVASNGRIIVGWLIGMDLEGSGHGLNEVLSQNMSGRTEKNHENSQDFRYPRRNSNRTRSERSRHTNPFGTSILDRKNWQNYSSEFYTSNLSSWERRYIKKINRKPILSLASY